MVTAHSRRGPTSTSSFGVSRREAHDASAFYERFPAPEIRDEDSINPHAATDRLWVGDARDMDGCGNIADRSVALVVTSPPYYAGKEYEQAVGHGHVPASYVDYLNMLEDVFKECVRKLEPGGRIAVNVANLGRRPYRSLSADVITILQDRLRLLLRGEVIWQKAKGAAGNCAWGSFQRPGNPVLRDLTERVVIASKGRFDRAQPAARRSEAGLPSEGSAHADEFMEATTDVWEIRPASARRVGHPAPFPVELPQRLIELYTYRGDLILDPFMGAGSTAVAAARSGRYYVGFDTDRSYVDLAQQRVAAEQRQRTHRQQELDWNVTVLPSTSDGAPIDGSDLLAAAAREGRTAQATAETLLRECGFTGIEQNVKKPCGVEVAFRALDTRGQAWHFDLSGAFSVTQRPGLRRAGALWEAIGKAATLHAAEPGTRLVLLTTDRPACNTAGHRALKSVTGAGKPVRAVIRMLSNDGISTLARLAR